MKYVGTTLVTFAGHAWQSAVAGALGAVVQSLVYDAGPTKLGCSVRSHICEVSDTLKLVIYINR